MKKVRIGTRASRLALAQAELAAAAFRRAGFAAEIVKVRTRGDEDIRSSLSEIGRGAFTDVFSEMIASGELDAAVHSAKDLPADVRKDSFYCLPRADARDVLLCVKGREPGSVGTCSPRRAAAVGKLFPGVRAVPVRGNVDTRIGRMLAGEFDALVLAAAGLERLGLLKDGAFCDERVCARILSVQECVPAACQGIIAVEGAAGKYIGDAAARRTALIERALQRALGGDCSGGLGAYFDGLRLFAQKDGRTESCLFEGEKSIAALAEKYL